MEVAIRRLEVDDASALNAAVAASRAHLAPWMEWAREPPMSEAARRRWIAGRIREAGGGGDEAFAVVGPDGGIRGMCGLHRRIGPGGLELGYWTHAGFLRQGVATAAVGLLVARARALPSVSRLEIHHDRGNVASGRVAAAAGFSHLSDRPDGAPVERVWRLDLGAAPG